MTRVTYGLVALAFGLTGFSALVYEIVWVRQTALIFGVSVYAYAAVVTAFLGGGALGHWLFGRVIDRVHHPLRLFALLQCGAAALALLIWFALPVTRALYAGLAHTWPLAPAPTFLLRGFLAVLLLTPGTVLMGGTLPAVSRWLAQMRRTAPVARLGRLYAWETAGAAAGCALTALWFLHHWPTHVSVLAAIGANLLAGLMAWGVHRLDGARTGRDAEPVETPAPARTARRGSSGLLLLYAGSGFMALGYQMVWSRILAIFTLDAVFSFAIVLTTFLLGLALGSRIAARVLRRRPPTRQTFARLQFLLAAGGLGTVYLFYFLPLLSLEDFFGSYTLSRAIIFEFVLGALVLLGPTSVMGYLFPVAVHLVSDQSPQGLGGIAGRVSAANTAGALPSILVTTFLLVPWAGLQGTLWLLTGGSLLLGLATCLPTPMDLKSLRSWTLWRLPGAVVLGLLLGFVWRPPPVYLGFRQDPTEHLVFYEEGAETTVAVFHVPEEDYKVSFVDGRIEVPTDAISMRAFRALGHLPPLVHPDAQRALMLSFGNGIATGSLETHGVPVIEAVDLSREMMQAAEFYWAENYNILRSPRLVLHVEDGRNFLLRTPHRYDIVTADATHPSNTSSWALFTREFYESVQSRLTPDGLFLQWLPFHSMTEADYRLILRTFQTVFPHASLWYTGSSHSLMMGTAAPFGPAELEALLARLAAHPTALADLGSLQQVQDYFTLDENQWRTYAGTGPVATDRQVYFLPAPDHVQEIALALLVARQS